MKTWNEKSSTEEIRRRFDADVERFSNLETGQQSTVDAPLHLQLIVDAIACLHPQGGHVLDIGCGAGNYTLKLLEKMVPASCTLVDLSAPMLERAAERVGKVFLGAVKTVHGDIREVLLPEGRYDTIMAAAVLHHLRGDNDWDAVFGKLFRLLKPGGSLWISDLICQEQKAVQDMMFNGHYGNYLAALKDSSYKEAVFAYIDKEDSPRSLNFQLRLLEKVGFSSVEILHKHLCFASFGGIK
ncbi:class I SAM-dependent methyltransferase [Olivibacter sitiensis]|uniref:class I SAM-dependent methyltransferase n=1 Tax=Olivibacter sitiensis TaxID=376470 RepID=UPI0003FD33B1|nr:class I SAM-dependent methyltransferase [Olivibacter sitiensis]